MKHSEIPKHPPKESVKSYLSLFLNYRAGELFLAQVSCELVPNFPAFCKDSLFSGHFVSSLWTLCNLAFVVSLKISYKPFLLFSCPELFHFNISHSLVQPSLKLNGAHVSNFCCNLTPHFDFFHSSFEVLSLFISSSFCWCNHTNSVIVFTSYGIF